MILLDMMVILLDMMMILFDMMMIVLERMMMQLGILLLMGISAVVVVSLQLFLPEEDSLDDANLECQQ